MPTCLNSMAFITGNLNGVHEGALHPIKDNDAEKQQHHHKAEAIAERGPTEVSLPQRSEAESLDDRGHRIGLDERAKRALGHHAEGIDDRRGIHPELHDEGEEDGQVAIFGGQRGDQDAESQAQPRDHQDEQRRERERPGDGNVRSAEIEHEIQAQEQPGLDEEAQQVGNHRGDRHHETGEIDFPEHVLIRDEGVGGLLEAVGEIEPADITRHVEENLRDAVRAHLGDAAEDKHVHQDGKDRLDQVPQRPKDRLLILHDNIAPHEEPNQVPVAPNLPKIQMPQLLLRPDLEGIRRFFFCITIHVLLYFGSPQIRRTLPLLETQISKKSARRKEAVARPSLQYPPQSGRQEVPAYTPAPTQI